MQEILLLYKSNMPDTLTISQFADTVTAPADTVLHTSFVRYEGIAIPSNAHTENWVFGIVFLLFILLVIGVNRSYNWILEGFKNMTKVRARSSIFSKTTAEEYQSRFLLTFFSTGVISLYLYLNLNTTEELSFSVYLLFLLAGLAFLFVKTQFMNFFAYVFLDAEALRAAKENYFNILSLLGFLLYPFLVLEIYSASVTNIKIFNDIALIISLLALIFLSIKSFRIFLHKILDFFHIMLYLCTLEILPLIGMFQVYKLIIKEF
ncbi:hypothetical protein SDC9_117757 [bioreactor metagenome]|uniref:DUF4271 domain-containing protein n=1 Tax=bioreactor metagenome TaxID=1076179 RepID=A0A645C0E1_9ZZZZ|nr:DUF4271 domain-containing protein [Paludibacter sp.]